MTSPCALLVFADDSGLRLDPALRRARAASLARTLSLVAAQPGARLFAGPADRAPAGFAVLPQQGLTFEARLLGAVRAAFARGHRRVVVLGGDHPELSARHLRAARAPGLALGPALDGGLYLIGLDAGDEGLLEGLPWQTAGLAARLRARLGARPSRWLRPLRDLDRVRDLQRLVGVVRWMRLPRPIIRRRVCRPRHLLGRARLAVRGPPADS